MVLSFYHTLVFICCKGTRCEEVLQYLKVGIYLVTFFPPMIYIPFGKCWRVFQPVPTFTPRRLYMGRWSWRAVFPMESMPLGVRARRLCHRASMLSSCSHSTTLPCWSDSGTLMMRWLLLSRGDKTTTHEASKLLFQRTSKNLKRAISQFKRT